MSREQSGPSEDGSVRWQRVRYVVACGFLACLGAAALAGVVDWPRAQHTHHGIADNLREGEASATAGAARTATAGPSLLGTLHAETASQALTGTAALSGDDHARALEEVRLLDSAAAALEMHQSERAVGVLDDYLRRYPRGVLAKSERVLRIQALLELSRRPDALGVLDGMRLEQKDQLLLVTRGELRADAGRCAEALPDYGLAMSNHPERTTAERALYGRAKCRTTLGDAAGAHDDYETYLSLYPDGARAPEVRKVLGKP